MAEGIDPADLVYDITVACCGREWRIPRALALAKRLEQAFGPLFPLATRLRMLQLTIPETARLMRVLLEGHADAPQQEAVEEWVFRRGLPALSPTLATDILSLVAGNAAVAERLRAASNKPTKETPGPFARAAD